MESNDVEICTLQSSSGHTVREDEKPPSYKSIEGEGPLPAYASNIVRKYKHCASLNSAGTKDIGFEQVRKIKFGKNETQNKFSETGSQK